MTPLEMIAEWHKGCSCAPKESPEECHECTRALIDALEARLKEPERIETKAIPDVRAGVCTGCGYAVKYCACGNRER